MQAIRRKYPNPDYVETNIIMRHEHVEMQRLLDEASAYVALYGEVARREGDEETYQATTKLFHEIIDMLSTTKIQIHDFGVPKE